MIHRFNRGRVILWAIAWAVALAEVNGRAGMVPWLGNVLCVIALLGLLYDILVAMAV